MKMATVKPAPGLTIVMPERNNVQLPDEGHEVPLDAYWRARLRDGDVVEVKPEAAKAPPPAPAKIKT